MARIVVGMSGGVDSSLAAALLAEAGHEVIGVTLRLWTPDSEAGTRRDACCSPSEALDARAVAERSGCLHYVFDAREAFRAAVVEDYLDQYAAGCTPNPCTRCNERIKFGLLAGYAQRLGAERVATGHYARLDAAGGRLRLRRAAQRDKDQSYFLFSLTQDQLGLCEFPVGALAKAQVRAEAARRGLPTAAKRESQDACFIGPEGVDGFLRRRISEAFRPGPIVHADGRELGRHQGLAAFTIGQRHGLGIAWREPLHVLHLDPTSNTVTVGERPLLAVPELHLRSCTWRCDLPIDCLVRLRHRGQPLPARIWAEGDAARVRFATPQARSSPGQACVAYDLSDEWCLGGGWVSS